jgi:tripartite-type tricarboxylate transporter receptor subunit TctC
MQTRQQLHNRKMTFICTLVVLSMVLAIVPKSIQSQEGNFPSKPVEVIVNVSPGGHADIVARIVGEYISKELRTPIVVKNIPGGGGLTGAVAFLNARPDGYTMFIGPIIAALQLSKNPPFDLRKDLLPVGGIYEASMAMAVGKNSPFESFDDFVKFAKNNPGKLKCGTTVLGTEVHYMFLAIKKDTKTDIKLVPYPGVGQMLAALMGGHLDFTTQTLPSAMPYVKSGDLRILLLSSASPQLPGIPVGSHIGLPSVSPSINGIGGFFVHPQTPQYAYKKLVSAVEAVVKNPECANKLIGLGDVVKYRNPKEFSETNNDQCEVFSTG